MPKCISILKVAIQIPEYDSLRYNVNVFDLDEPADPVDLSNIAASDLQFLFGGGYRRRRNQKKGPRVRQREYKINEFVDSSRAIIGSSQENESGEDSEKSRKIINSQEA